MDKRLLSIVVPTKDRYYTLSKLVEGFSYWDSELFEVVIQDNSEDNSTFIDGFDKRYKDDKRIKYFYNKENLSVVENSDLGYKNSNAEYICFLGDDDGAIFEIIDLCKWMKKNEIDSIAFKKATFKWPNLIQKITNDPKSNGHLSFQRNELVCKVVDVQKNLIKQLKMGSQNTFNGPSPYHGLVSKKRLDEMYKVTGTYFPGPTPDMASSVGMSFFVKKHVFINIPFVISGQALKSAGGMGARGKHIGELEDIPWLPKETAKNWSKELPYFWTGETITAESAIKALERTGNGDLKRHLNINRVLALCYIYNSVYRKRIIEHTIKNNKLDNNISILDVIKEFIYVSVSRVYNKLKSKLLEKMNKSVTKRVVDCPNIVEAMDEVSINTKDIVTEFYTKYSNGVD